MNTQELNAYRLTSLEEPSDEMLSAIMREAAEEAAESNKRALQELFERINRRIAELHMQRNIA